MRKTAIFLILTLLSAGVFAQTKVMTIRKFQGLNSSISEEDLPPEYGTIVENIRLDKYGALEKRPLRSEYNATSLGSNDIPFNYRYYHDDTQEAIVSYTGSLLTGNDALGTFSVIEDDFTDGERHSAVTYKDVFYTGNGVDPNFHYDGTYQRDMGVAGPGASGMSAAEGAGNDLMLAGTYQYQVTFLYDDYQESNPNSDSVAVALAASKNVNLTAIPLGTDNENVTDRKLYRTTAGGSVYYLLDTLENNTATTYEDSALDADLDTTTTPPSNHDSPENCKYFIVNKERIFAAGDPNNASRLYFSLIENGISYPDILPSTYYLEISPDDGEKIMGLALDPAGVLCVFKQNTMFKVFTDGPRDQWQVSAPYESAGVVAPYSLVRTPYGLIFLSRSGQDVKELRIFDGNTSKVVSHAIEPTLETISDTYINNVVATYHDGKYKMAYTDETSGVTYNNKVLIFDIEKNFFSIDTGKNIASFGVWNAGDDEGELYAGDSVLGKLYREDAYSQDIKFDTLSEFNEGAYTQTESGGTESSPQITLDESELSDDIAAQTWAALSGSAWQQLTGDLDTWYFGGTYTSPVIEANAKEFLYITWNEDLDDGSAAVMDISHRVRSGETSGACAAAQWGSWGSASPYDISDESADTYVQFQSKLTSSMETSTPILQKEGDYAVWLNFGLGTIAETSVPFVYQTGYLDLGIPYADKRFEQLRTRHDGGNDTFSIYYKLDDDDERSFSVDLSSYGRSVKKNFPYNASFAERVRFRIEENSNQEFSLKEIKLLFQEEPVSF